MMMQEQQSMPLAVASFAGEETLLLKLGESDESLYYQAAIGTPISATSFFVYLHQTSLVLERLRFLGALDVLAQMGDGVVYRASLSLSDACVGADASCSALLTLTAMHDEAISEPRLLPLT